MDAKRTNVASYFSALKVSRILSLIRSMLTLFTGTDNLINKKNGGYEHVTEFIPIAQPNVTTLAKLDTLQPSSVCGDRMSYIWHLVFVHEHSGSYRCPYCRN